MNEAKARNLLGDVKRDSESEENGGQIAMQIVGTSRLWSISAAEEWWLIGVLVIDVLIWFFFVSSLLTFFFFLLFNGKKNCLFFLSELLKLLRYVFFLNGGPEANYGEINFRIEPYTSA